MPGLIYGKFNTTPDTMGSGQDTIIQTDAQGRILLSPNSPAPVGGGITWGAVTAVAMTGSSKTFVPANAARKAIIMWNPAANAAGAIDLAGGTVVLATSLPLYAGGSPTVAMGAPCPVGVITAIGTNTQSFYYQEGT